MQLTNPDGASAFLGKSSYPTTRRPAVEQLQVFPVEIERRAGVLQIAVQ